MNVAVVGGGISGLAAAWELVQRGAQVTVFEPGRLGGVLGTSELGGGMVDEAADAFITRQPAALDMCRELGLGEDLVAPAAGRSMLWWRDRLRPLPAGLVLGLPTNVGALLTSGILGPTGLARAAVEPLLPRRGGTQNLTVRDLVGRRFGWQVADRLVDPLLGGISAGWTGELGARELAPQIVEAAERHRSLLLGLRPKAGGAAPGGPIFFGLRGGMARLVGTLTAALVAGGAVLQAEEVGSIAPTRDGGVVLGPGGSRFDGAVVATRSPTAAALLGPPAAALADIPSSSVAIAAVSLTGLELPAGYNGFLVPRDAGLLTTACSFASNKWPHWSPDGTAIVRISCGRRGDSRFTAMDDEALVGRLLDELGRCLGRSLNAGPARVWRWPEAFPQYLPGHAARLAATEDALRRAVPAVRLAGSYHSGLGVPACIATGRRAASGLHDSLAARTG